jgi:endonuclease YncB( thermonuclease family)
MRTVTPLLFAMLIFGALIAGSRDAAAATPIGTSGEIAFDVGAEGTNSALYTAHIGGSPKRISAAGALDGQAAWSPDGTRIAFFRIAGGNIDVYVMNADGSNVRRVTTNPGEDASASWSPDGTQLAFDTDRDANSEIYVINVDGTKEHRLTDNPADDSFPAWSPDGKKIAFQSNRTGNYEIFEMNPDGTDQVDVTNNPADDFVPNWSGTAKKIAFIRVISDQDEVFSMDANGGAQTRLTNSPANDDFPAWSPDGSKIVYSHWASSTNPDVWVMNADGTNPQAVFNTSQPEYFPDWQPPICTVATIIDGDTFGCDDGTTVDMLGIDAAELGACGGDWAKAALQNIFLPVGRKVALAFDATTSTPDGHVLAAPIWLGDDGTDYNISIVMAYVGLAKASVVGAGNTKYQDWASASQNWAQAAQWNMWAPGKTYNGGC